MYGLVLCVLEYMVCGVFSGLRIECALWFNEGVVAASLGSVVVCVLCGRVLACWVHVLCCVCVVDWEYFVCVF